MNQMQQMLQQAQRMQRQLQKAHAELDAKEFTVEKAGLVTVILTGDKKVKSISVDKDALNPDDAEMVQPKQITKSTRKSPDVAAVYFNERITLHPSSY